MRAARIPLCLFLIAAAGVATTTPATAAAAADTRQSAAPLAGTQAIALRIRELASGQVEDFYASRGFWPLWAANGKIGPEADMLVGFLETADLDGLAPSSYKVDELVALIRLSRGGDADAVARAELGLSRAFAAYVRDMRRRSRVRMDYADPTLKPRKLRVEAVLRAAALPKSFGNYMKTMGWMSPHYLRLRNLLAQAEKQGASEEDRDRIRLNMDRARLLPGPAVRHIVVDAASGRLWYYQAGEQLGMMKVVVGAAETQTPMLAGMMRYAIINPYWNVPVYLAQNKIAPKILAGRTLKSMGMEVLSDWSAQPQVLDGATVDWASVAARKQEVRLRQLPGRDNSMGRVKFMFPNDEGIYLHDTPDRELFAEKDRHFSNGCIRLEDAARLGKWLLGRPVAGISKQPEHVVALSAPVPVYLTYLTATPTEKGAGFLKDVYGRDR